MPENPNAKLIVALRRLAPIAQYSDDTRALQGLANYLEDNGDTPSAAELQRTQENLQRATKERDEARRTRDEALDRLEKAERSLQEANARLQQYVVKEQAQQAAQPNTNPPQT